MGSGGIGFVACPGPPMNVISLVATACPGLVLASFTLKGLAEAGLWMCVGLGVDPGSSPARPPAAWARLVRFGLCCPVFVLFLFSFPFGPSVGGGNEAPERQCHPKSASTT